MPREIRKEPTKPITSVDNRRSSVARIVKRTTLRDESRDAKDSMVDEQVAALKKIPADKIVKNEIETKAAETGARLREAQSENIRLSSVVESSRKDMDRYRRQYEKALEETKLAIDATNESEKQRIKSDSMIEELQHEIQTLRKELSGSRRPEKRTRYLQIQPDHIAEMISDFERALSVSFTGLILSNLELTLKVVIDNEGDRPILLLPPINKTNIRSEVISELIIRVLPSEV
jgi:hypothetical protein